MELICPECRGEMGVPQGRTVVCPLHGGQYEVLFDREAETLAVKTLERPLSLEGKTCTAHPRQDAVADCVTCGKPLCGVCTFDVGGRRYCSDCAVSGATAAPQAAIPPEAQTKTCPMCNVVSAATAAKCDACGHQFGLLNLQPPRRTTVPAGVMCVQHREEQAVARCRACSQGMCATCDFELPGGLHICPNCIDKAGDEDISPKRMKLAIWSIVVAIYVTFMIVLLFTGTLVRAFGEAALEALAGYLIFFPMIVGTALAFGAYDRRLKNTTIIWIGLVWNSVMLGIFLILMIVGLLS